ncbi:MAG: DUF4340 domain-containing protein [Phycisphaerales bacterium]|nr:DUF4340 domain-containing protein [Phycisphaerales bacterium]
MNEMMKTAAICGGAVVLAIVASTMGPKEIKNDLFSDQGELFFPQFTDPTAAVDLEVTQFLEGSAEARKFAVRRDAEGRWTIPSHGNYPADAKDRMGKAAALLIGLKKEQCVGERKEDEVAYGVVDPLDGGTETKGRGTRVTMKDSAGNVLADLVIGKEVEKKMQVRYLRAPGKKRVYAAKLDGEVSTKFADWIETDLLKAQSWDIAKVTMDNYSVDETSGTIKKGDVYVASKDDAGKWAFDGLDAAKEEPNEDKLREIGDTLGQIKIVGVRKKPEGLTAMLEQATGFDRQILRQTLAEKGYFVANNGKLVSNEGDLLFETKKGVRYTLRFGELVPGSGLDVSSGAEDPKNKPKEGEASKPGDSRYLMVTAEFQESLLPKPTGARLPQEQLDKRATARRDIEDIQKAVEAFRSKNENKLPESLAKLAEKPAEGAALLAELKKDPWGNDYILSAAGDSYLVISYADGNAEGGEGAAADVRSDRLPLEDELKKTADAWAEHDRKVEDGRKEAEKLTKRFAGWYYVIDSALFSKLKPKRADLVKPKAAEAPAAGTAPGGGNEPPK